MTFYDGRLERLARAHARVRETGCVRFVSSRPLRVSTWAPDVDGHDRPNVDDDAR